MDIKECQQELNSLFCRIFQRNILYTHLKKYNIINFPKSNLILKNNSVLNNGEITENNSKHIFNINFNNKYCDTLDIKKINDFLLKKKDNQLIYYFKFICNEIYSNNNILEKYIYEYQINKFISDINYNNHLINNDIYKLLMNIFDIFYFKYINDHDIVFNDNIKHDDIIFKDIIINLNFNSINSIRGKINSKFFNREKNKIVLDYDTINKLYDKLIISIKKNKLKFNKINIIRPITFFELNGNDIFINKSGSQINTSLNKFYIHNKITHNFGSIIYKNYIESLTLDIILKQTNIIIEYLNVNNIEDINNLENKEKITDLTNGCNILLNKKIDSNFLKLIDNNATNIEEFIDSILFQIIFTLYKIYIIYPSFRHNDLHMKNIIIYSKKNERNSYYNIDNNIFLIKKKFGLKIIDFELSSINQIIFNKYIDNKCFYNTYGLSNETKPDYDLHFFLNILYNNTKVNKYKEFVLRYIPSEYLFNNNICVNNWRLRKRLKLNLCFDKILSDKIFSKFLLYKL